MKKNYIPFVCAAAFAFVFASCGSSPDAKPDTKVENAAQKAGENPELVAAEDARKAALEAGADKAAAAQFAAADALYQPLKAQAEAGKDVSAGLKDAEERFRALVAYADAKKAKERIDANGYASYDRTSYDRGSAALKELDNLFGSTANLTGSSMRVKADEANGAFKNVIRAAFRKFAKDERLEAFRAKRDADAVMAAVAAKTEYAHATDEFRTGDANYAQQNPESAYNHYKEAKTQFVDMVPAVAEKRKAAKKAMDEARQKVAESNLYAVKADREAPLAGDSVQGIEAADAKLLEDDSFADPAAQKASIPETIPEEAAQ